MCFAQFYELYRYVRTGEQVLLQVLHVIYMYALYMKLTINKIPWKRGGVKQLKT